MHSLRRLMTLEKQAMVMEVMAGDIQWMIRRKTIMKSLVMGGELPDDDQNINDPPEAGNATEHPAEQNSAMLGVELPVDGNKPQVQEKPQRQISDESVLLVLSSCPMMQVIIQHVLRCISGPRQAVDCAATWPRDRSVTVFRG